MDQIIAEARPVAFEQPQYMVGSPATMAYPTAAKLCQSGDFIGVGNIIRHRAVDLFCQLGRYPLIGVERQHPGITSEIERTVLLPAKPRPML